MARQVATKIQGKQRFKFFSEIISELKKVVWPRRQDAMYLTTIVIIATAAVAIILSLIDRGFSELMDLILFK